MTQHKIATSAVTTDKIADHAVTSVKIVDGPGSGLNADVLDGIDSSLVLVWVIMFFLA